MRLRQLQDQARVAARTGEAVEFVRSLAATMACAGLVGRGGRSTYVIVDHQYDIAPVPCSVCVWLVGITFVSTQSTSCSGVTVWVDSSQKRARGRALSPKFGLLGTM